MRLVQAIARIVALALFYCALTAPNVSHNRQTCPLFRKAVRKLVGGNAARHVVRQAAPQEQLGGKKVLRFLVKQMRATQSRLPVEAAKSVLHDLILSGSLRWIERVYTVLPV